MIQKCLHLIASDAERSEDKHICEQQKRCSCMNNVPLFIVVVRHKILYEITFISLNFINMIYIDN